MCGEMCWMMTLRIECCWNVPLGTRVQTLASSVVAAKSTRGVLFGMKSLPTYHLCDLSLILSFGCCKFLGVASTPGLVVSLSQAA